MAEKIRQPKTRPVLRLSLDVFGNSGQLGVRRTRAEQGEAMEI